MTELQEVPRTGPSLPLVGAIESHPAPGVLPVDGATPRAGTRARASDPAPSPLVTDEGAGAPARSRRLLARSWLVLGAIGMVSGATVLGVVAHRVAHPVPTVALIASLGAVAGGAIGAALPALARALTWSVIAAATLAVAAGALWGIHQVDPLLVRQFVPRW